jgi:SAM-dependent methyltransferase
VNSILSQKPKFLHFAPEQGLEVNLRKVLREQYYTADMLACDVNCRVDITALCFKDNLFDFVYCSNVLEHVIDDRSAMADLFRITKAGGTVFIQVPVKGEHTYEDYSITNPTDRAVHFGQADHVRFYGRDIRFRLEEAGFQVDEIDMPGALQLTHHDMWRMNLNKRELVHSCTKPF